MQRFILLISLTLLLSACISEGTEVDNSPSPFFDLEGYIAAESARLSSLRPKVEKTITLNGETEAKEITDINFENDLRLFKEADINKPAWHDKYDTKEKTLSAGHVITSYLARDSSLTVRRLMVEQDQKATIKVEIERHTGSVLSDGHHLLTYEPARGYEVSTNQTNRFGEDVKARIVVRW
ncbi:hypothetical protein FUA23_12085 [Neolewinella aurantiaca]|uniref:Lipoprotein n=1 Tax=Neolewinella aurantiaca TaxID=2602767 RepID=A0A5C7FUC6_9BACT|nr:hypothetical protein [Neolewinella aurantiaca]TXF89021.1 hypothetical protein FUA23_12085 [Neolewinella aurantiaca]